MTTNAKVVEAEQFYHAYTEAFKVTAYPGFLAVITLDDLKKQRATCFLTPDRQCGVSVYREDDKVYAQCLFNVGSIPGAGYSLFEHVVQDQKVTDLDAFDGPLIDMYRTLGFETVEKVEFDPQYAHDWNYERDGRPDVHFMRKEWS